MEKTIVKTDNYLLIVDDSEIKKGDLILTPYGKVVKALDVHTTKFTGVGTALNDCQKIIAHLPLNDSPVLEGVTLLPPIEEDDVWSFGLKEKLDELPYTKHLDDGGYNDGQVVGFEIGAEWGYKKAREKYKFTEKDVLRIIHMSKEEKNINPSCDDNMWVAKYSKDELIQSLSQPKTPTHFEFEVEDELAIDGHTIIGRKPKTTTNSQGQEVACGKYVYAS